MHTFRKRMAYSLLAGLMASISCPRASAFNPETVSCATAESDVCKSAQALKEELGSKYRKLEKEAMDYCAKYANMKNYQSYGSAAAPSVCAQNYINKTNPQLDDTYRDALRKRDRACSCPDS